MVMDIILYYRNLFAYVDIFCLSLFIGTLTPLLLKPVKILDTFALNVYAIMKTRFCQSETI